MKFTSIFSQGVHIIFGINSKIVLFYYNYCIYTLLLCNFMRKMSCASLNFGFYWLSL